jgi:hypothetical protein
MTVKFTIDAKRMIEASVRPKGLSREDAAP